MVEGLEAELPRASPPAQFAEIVFAANRCIGMDEIGDRGHGLGESGLGLRELGLESPDLVLLTPALRGVGFAFGDRHRPFARALMFIAVTIGVVERSLHRGHPFLVSDGRVDVDRDPATPAALDDLVATSLECARVQHTREGSTRARPAQPRCPLHPGACEFARPARCERAY